MAVTLTEQGLKETMQNLVDYANGLDKDFIEQGLEEIKNCGIDGDKKANIVKVADAIAENMHDVTKQVRVVGENICTIVDELVAFNANDVFASITAAAQSGVETVVKPREAIFPE